MAMHGVDRPSLLRNSGMLLLAAVTAHATTIAMYAADGVLPSVAHGASATLIGVALAGLLGAVAGRLPLALVLAAWISLQFWWPPSLSAFVVGGAALLVLGRFLPGASVELALAAGVAVPVALFLLPEIAFHTQWTNPRLGLVALFVTLVGSGLVLGWIGRREHRRAALTVAMTLGLAFAFAAISSVVSVSARPPLPSYETGEPTDRPHVILIVLDTVAATHLGVYGYERDTTPHLAAFLRKHPRSAVYPHAFSTGSWTLPSHGSLFTGLRPSEHGLHLAGWLASGIPAPVAMRAEETLAERARAHGYRTGGIVANGLLFHAAPGVARGFDWWTKPAAPREDPLLGGRIAARWLPNRGQSPFRHYPAADRISSDVLRFVDRCLPGPCFVFANYMDAHHPYLPDAMRRGAFWQGPDAAPPDAVPGFHDPPEVRDYLRARYDEEILGLDAKLVALLDSLEARGVLDDAWVVVTSDHGEAFDAGRPTSHGTSLYDTQVRVPLILLPPAGQEVAATEQAASGLDVATTLALIASGRGLGEGADLRQPLPANHVAPIEFYGDPRAETATAHGVAAALPGQAAVSGSLKLIEQGGRREVYDLGRDPGETRDLSATIGAAQLRRHAGAIDRPLEASERDPALDPLPARVRDELKALGYLGP